MLFYTIVQEFQIKELRWGCLTGELYLFYTYKLALQALEGMRSHDDDIYNQVVGIEVSIDDVEKSIEHGKFRITKNKELMRETFVLSNDGNVAFSYHKICNMLNIYEMSGEV